MERDIHHSFGNWQIKKLMNSRPMGLAANAFGCAMFRLIAGFTAP